MTTQASNWSQTGYVAGVTHKLQSKGFLLKPATMPPVKLQAGQAVWKVAGLGSATERSTAIEERPVMNADRSTITGSIKNYEANDWINTTDLDQMTEDERQVSQQTAAMALGRRFDRIIMAEMDADTTNITTQGDGSAAISTTDILKAQADIFNEGVGSYEYFCALPSIFMSQLELFKEFANADYVGEEMPLLKQAGARRWRGITFIPLPFSASNTEKNFFNVPSANQADAFLWAKESMGFYATYGEMKSRIDYVPTRKAYFAANDMAACPKVLLPEGVKRLRFATNIALSRSNV
jgi:hypothetical protein